jgi:hypothetical protein
VVLGNTYCIRRQLVAAAGGGDIGDCADRPGVRRCGPCSRPAAQRDAELVGALLHHLPILRLALLFRTDCWVWLLRAAAAAATCAPTQYIGVNPLRFIHQTIQRFIQWSNLQGCFGTLLGNKAGWNFLSARALTKSPCKPLGTNKQSWSPVRRKATFKSSLERGNPALSHLNLL